MRVSSVRVSSVRVSSVRVSSVRVSSVRVSSVRVRVLVVALGAAIGAGCTLHIHLEAGIRHDGNRGAVHGAVALAIGSDTGNTSKHELDELAGLSSLRYLDLTARGVKDVSALARLPKLEKVRVFGYAIAKLKGHDKLNGKLVDGENGVEDFDDALLECDC